MLKIAALIIAVNLLLGTEGYLASVGKNPKNKWLDYVLYIAPFWMPWILITPLLLRLARRLRLDRGPRLKAFGYLLLVLGGVLVVHLLLMSLSIWVQSTLMQGAQVGKMAVYFQTLPVRVPLSWALRNLIVFSVILAVSYTATYRQELRDKEVQASRLEGQLARAELQSLKSQLHPHFLFNALNAISTLMRTDLAAAEHMLDLVSDLLRRSLRESAAQEVPLSAELDFVSRYLEIERVRFSNRLTVVVDVPPELREALVPHLILQPLVENAIRHGIGPKVGAGTVRIEGREHEGLLELQVRDDGMGSGRRRESEGAGVGLANTQARLQQLYGGKASLAYGPGPERGFDVRLRLPLRKVETP